MTVIYNSALAPGGPDGRTRTVVIRLVAGGTGGFLTADHSEILYTAEVEQASSGYWSIDLDPNSLIDPPDTYYTVAQGREVLAFQVPDVGGPYWIHDVLLLSPQPSGAIVTSTPGPAGAGVPAGGGTGYALTKTSGTDYATAWTDLSPVFARPSAIDLRDFGATGNGTTDDTAAVLAAFTSAATNQRGEIYVPDGTYILTPDPTSKICVEIPSGVKTVRGSSRDRAFFRVANNVGQYKAIFQSSSDASGLSFSDLTIDQNTVNNPVPVDTTIMTGGQYRFMLLIKSSSDILSRNLVRNVHFKDIGSVNPLIISGSVPSATVTECTFTLGPSYAHDHSTVFIKTDLADGVMRIENNDFHAPSGSNGYANAIETHGGSQIVIGNLIKSYRRGITVTGLSVIPNASIIVRSNTILKALNGIKLYSGTYQTYSGPIGLRNCTVSDNEIHLSAGYWQEKTNGIVLDASTIGNLPITDVDIVRNRICFDDAGYTTVVGDTSAVGIDWTRGNIGTLVDRRITISDNFIDSPSATGIRVGIYAGSTWDISRNKIRNAGNGTSLNGGAIAADLSNGIWVQCPFTNSTIRGNKITDDRTTPAVKRGVWIAHTTNAAADNVLADNYVEAYTSKPIQTDVTNAGWLIKHEGPTYVAPGGPVAYGSTFLAKTTGTLSTQTVAPSGSTWSS